MLSLFKKNENGFTLLELIMVIIILGIMAAVVIPKLSNDSVDVYSAASQVQSDFRYAQERAMGGFRRVTISFTANTGNYTITAPNISNAAVINEFRQLPPGSRATFNATTSFTYNSTGELHGNDWGKSVNISTPQGSPGALTLKQITVQNLTGRAAF